MKLLTAILFLPLILAASVLQAPAGCTSAADYATLADAWSAAQTSRCLDIPAGEYAVQPGQLASSAQGLTVRGAGIGRTILRLSDDLIVNARTYVLRFTGAHQSVSDLTIQGGANASGPREVLGISVEAGATYTHIARVEVAGLYGGTTAGASGIDLVQPWNVGGGFQGATIEACYIHDMPHGTGIIVNSNGNTIRGCHIRDVGNSTQRHGIYIQGGGNLFDGNLIERVGGYSLHAWQKVQAIDGSGNIYRANVSVDPGFQHMVVSGLPSNGTNPAIPTGRPLTRSATITGNMFRNTAGRTTGGIGTDVPALISDNTFEDVTRDGAPTIHIANGAAGSIIRGNAFRAHQPASTNGGAIKLDSAAIVEGNAIDMRAYVWGQAISGSPAGLVVGQNMIYRST